MRTNDIPPTTLFSNRIAVERSLKSHGGSTGCTACMTKATTSALQGIAESDHAMITTTAASSALISFVAHARGGPDGSRSLEELTMSRPLSSWYRILLEIPMWVPQQPALSSTLGGLFCSLKLASSLLRIASRPLLTAVPAIPAPKPTMPKSSPCTEAQTAFEM